MPRHSTPLTDEKHSVKGSLTPFLGENVISAKDIPKLEEWPTFSGEGEYNHIEFIRTIDMLQEDFHIPDELIVGKLQSLFTRTAKKWYYKMEKDHGKHDCSWWKSEMITKWANNSWRFKIGNAFENMSDTMINMKILRKCGGELEHAIKCRCVEPFSTEEYINSMEDIITRTRIGKTWTKIPMESKMVPKISNEDRKPETPVLMCHKCGSTSNLANSCTKKTKINEAQVIEEVQCTEGKEESDLDSAVSEHTPVEDYPIENITAFFEGTEVHNDLPQYSEDCHNLINIQDARMSKTKPARGAIKGHEVDITLNIARPYPPVLSRPAYPANPRAREALEKYIQELNQLCVLRKVGHNEEVEVTTPFIIAWNNDKSRMVGDFRALNTYRVPDRNPIPRIQETLTQLSKAKYITSIDSLKGFQKAFFTPTAEKLLRIISHCGIYEYLTMPFGIKNAPSHYQRMMNTIFCTELSE
ncbi:hypothetical protein O181_071767 [Austropuccinia psidii MF-1]|uniref:Reverse transcriptase domain-containing protein n=1 Tax=Austropuccinia psidii MF-1 TaxID=1389203 RepID=A0A9Q3F894_9BASI|nr:hypothetical protein [Austropuccinia psidii MF-1]